MWLRILLVLLSAAIIQVITQNVISTLPSNYQACPGEKITFTCDVKGPILAWSSEDYIGSSGTRLEFGTGSDEPNGTYSHSSTVATLLRRNGVVEIVSQLEIIASVTGSVVCHDVSAGKSQSVHFNVTVNPSSPPQDLYMNQSDCTFKLFWKILEGADHYLVTIESGNTATKINASNNMIRHPLTTDMIRVKIVAVNRCGQEGPASSSLQWKTNTISECCNINIEPTPCRLIPTGTNDVINNNNMINTNSNNINISGSIAATVGFLVLAVIITLIVVIILLCRRLKQKYGSRSHEQSADEKS